MKYKLNLDENNYLTGFVHTGTEEDTFELFPSSMDLSHLTCYKMVDGSLIFDEEKKAEVINARKKENEREKEISAQTLKLAEMFVDMGIDADTFLSRIDAQVLYSALMTDTLLEDEGEEE